MNDAEAERQQARVLAELAKWIEILGICNYRWKHEFYREPIPSANGAIGQVTVHWQYLQVHAEWSLPEIAELDERYLDYAVLHELMHVIVNEMSAHPRSKNAEGHEERVVSTLALACQWVYDAGRDAHDALAFNG